MRLLPNGAVERDLLAYIEAAGPLGCSATDAAAALGKSRDQIKATTIRLRQKGSMQTISGVNRALHFTNSVPLEVARVRFAEVGHGAGKVAPQHPAQKKRPKKRPKKPRPEREQKHEFRRPDLDAQPKKAKPPVHIDDSRAKITRSETNPSLMNRWHTDTVPSLFGAMGIGKYLPADGEAA
jgi:hypothetical protein